MEGYSWYEMERQVQQYIWYTRGVCVHLDLGKRGPCPDPHSGCPVQEMKNGRSQGIAPTWSLHSSAQNSCPASPKLASRTHAGLFPHSVLKADCTTGVYIPVLKRCSRWAWMELGHADWGVHMHAHQDPSGKLKLEVNGDKPRGLGEEQANLANSYL